jgi:hypothetical protein
MKKKRGRTLFLIFFLPVFFFALSCSSLPSLPDAEIPAEVVVISDEPEGSADSEELFFPEVAADEEAAADEEPAMDDTPDVRGRAEEALAYLDTPVNPDLPEPDYAIPEPEPAVAEAEPLPGENEPIEPAAEVADETEYEAPSPQEDVLTEEIVVEEPPPVPSPPAILRPVREIAAAPPLPVPPNPLPMQPARVPPNETKMPGDTPLPTRTMQVALGENAEVPLVGSGWVYLGEADSQSGLAYRQRRASADGQTFVFRPESTGSYRLTFKKQDLIRGTETSEIVEVAVVEKNKPDEPAAEPTMVDTPVADAETPGPPVLARAIPDTNDTALWNRGQELEAPGPNRDIKGALTAYKTLVRDYPQSEYYTDSQKRIAYIERYFVNIR